MAIGFLPNCHNSYKIMTYLNFRKFILNNNKEQNNLIFSRFALVILSIKENRILQFSNEFFHLVENFTGFHQGLHCVMVVI